MIAAINGRTDIATLLLHEANTLKNVVACNGATAMMWAALNDKVDVVKLLLAHGCDTNAATTSGVTALMEAAERGHVDVVELLLNARCDVGATTMFNGNKTALDIAYQHGHANVLEALLMHGAYSPVISGYPRRPTTHTWLTNTLMLCFSPTLTNEPGYTCPYFFSVTPGGDVKNYWDTPSAVSAIQYILQERHLVAGDDEFGLFAHVPVRELCSIVYTYARSSLVTVLTTIR